MTLAHVAGELFERLGGGGGRGSRGRGGDEAYLEDLSEASSPDEGENLKILQAELLRVDQHPLQRLDPLRTRAEVRLSEEWNGILSAARGLGLALALASAHQLELLLVRAQQIYLVALRVENSYASRVVCVLLRCAKRGAL